MQIRIDGFLAVISALFLFAACGSDGKTAAGYATEEEKSRKASVTAESLPETSAVKVAWALKKANDKVYLSLVQQKREERAHLNDAQKLGKKFGFLYKESKWSPDSLLPEKYYYLDEFSTPTGRAVENIFPQCVRYDANPDRREFNTTCIYTSFILKRLSKNSNLAAAFTTAKQANVEIVLTFTYFAVEPARIIVNIATDDAVIINFILNDSKIATKK